jgi:hypothetical protein
MGERGPVKWGSGKNQSLRTSSDHEQAGRMTNFVQGVLLSLKQPPVGEPPGLRTTTHQHWRIPLETWPADEAWPVHILLQQVRKVLERGACVGSADTGCCNCTRPPAPVLQSVYLHMLLSDFVRTVQASSRLVEGFGDSMRQHRLAPRVESGSMSEAPRPSTDTVLYCTRTYMPVRVLPFVWLQRICAGMGTNPLWRLRL